LPLLRREALDAIAAALGRLLEEPSPGNAPHREATRPLRVLLAEDHPVNLLVAVRMLEEMGHEVLVASDGQRAAEIAGRGGLDVALLDIQMPGTDGLEGLALIRTREAETGKPRLPAIALTAHALAEDRENCLRAGFDAHLAKPFRSEELRDLMSRVVSDPRVVQGGGRDPNQPRSSDIGRRLIELCEGDLDFQTELVSAFLESAPTTLERIERATARADADSLRAEAHALKGICLTIGADSLAARARKIEDVARAGDLAAASSLFEVTRKDWVRLREELADLLVRPDLR
jgi:CheY-like chemotaxis protein